MKPLEQLSDDEFGQLLRSAVALEGAPEPLIRSAIDLWAGTQATPLHTVIEQALSTLRTLRAVLSFDSWAPQSQRLNLSPGLRSLPSTTRHLLFSAEGRDIDLRIAPSHAGFSVVGQILGPDEAGDVELRGPVTETAPEAAVALAALDSLGEFRFDGVARGCYQMRLRLSGEVIELPALDVGDRPG